MPRIQVARQNKGVESTVTSQAGKSIVPPYIPFSERLKEDTQQIFEDFASDLENVLWGYTHILEYIEDNGKMDLTRKGMEQLENLCKGIVCEYVSTYLNRIQAGDILDKMSVSQERVRNITSYFLNHNLDLFTTDVANEITRLTQDGAFAKIVIDEIFKPLEESKNINKGEYFFKNEDDMLVCFDSDDWEYTCCDIDQEGVSTVGGHKTRDVIVHSIGCLIEALMSVWDYADEALEMEDLREIIRSRLNKKYDWDDDGREVAIFCLNEIVSDDIDFMLQRFIDEKERLLPVLNNLQKDGLKKVKRADNFTCPFSFGIDVSVNMEKIEAEMSASNVSCYDKKTIELLREAIKLFYSRDEKDYYLNLPINGGEVVSIKNPIEVAGTQHVKPGYELTPRYISNVSREGDGSYILGIGCFIVVKDSRTWYA